MTRLVGLISSILLLANCGGSAVETTVHSATTAPTTTTTDALNAEDVFSSVAPSIAFITTSIGTGSAVMIDADHVITNAHVVWPFETARVVFPDGTELTEAPVVGWDMMADLAVLDVSAASELPAPLTFAGGDDLAIGSEVFLVGYPAEDEEFPQPTISMGILSRLRTWEEADLTYLQTDAAIDGGQSGGALVSDRGDVIGISSLSFGEGFALALSGHQAFGRAGQLLNNQDPDGLGDRRVPTGVGSLQASGVAPNFADEVTWMINGEVGDPIEITVNSNQDIAVSIVAPDGVIEVTVDDTASGSEVVEFKVAATGPHFLVVYSVTTEFTEFEVTSSTELVSLPDSDHGGRLSVGETTIANGDYPSDIDWFLLELAEGDSVTISVSSLNIDPFVSIDLPDNEGEMLAFDDDSGGGILGTDAEVSFTAPADNDYLISVSDTTGFGPGGYFIIVEETP